MQYFKNQNIESGVFPNYISPDNFFFPVDTSCQVAEIRAK